MPDPYPAETRYEFRPGVTCLTTPAGAVLLGPPHSERLTGLTAPQLQACQALSREAATASELSAAAEPGEVNSLLDRLASAGWLTVTVRDAGRQWYSILPFGPPGPAPRQRTGDLVLSKFTILHRDSAGFILEHPLARCDIRIDDARLLAMLDGSVAADAGPPTARFAADLFRYGFLVVAGAEDGDFESLSWSAHDLWFHRRSTLGERVSTWEQFGPTRWARDRFGQPPARRPDYAGEPIALVTPDLADRRTHDPTLTTVAEERVSTRTFDDAEPITVDELAELLYRTARTREVRPAGPGEELLSRPYPSGGGLYELELYPVVRNVAGLPPGMFHYDSFEHLLRPVAGADSPAVAQLLKPAAATLTGGAEPQVLLVIAARAGRIMWTYQQIGYATVLKDVGALMQTIYLAATAMGLGACAQGFSDTAAFVAATGVDERQECSVGSIIIGSAGAPPRQA